MMKMLRSASAAALFLGIGLTAGCASHAPQQPSTATPATAAPLSLATPVGTIAANPAGKAILDRDVPGLTSSASYSMIQGMSLPQLQPLSGGKLSNDELNHVKTDLAQLPAGQ